MYFILAIIIFILQFQSQSIRADGICPVITQDFCPYGVSERTGEVVKLVPKYLPRDHLEYDVRTAEEAKGKIHLYCAHPACDYQVCLNGGTCMEELDGFRCVCPYYSYGMHCEYRYWGRYSGSSKYWDRYSGSSEYYGPVQ